MAWYNAGTVLVTNGSTTVTGTGTAFVANVSIGESFVGPDGRPYEISNVVSDTELTLAINYGGSTASGQNYSILPARGRIADLIAETSSLLASFTAVRDGVGAGLHPVGTSATPSMRGATDQDTGLNLLGSNALALVSGGAEAFRVNSATNVLVSGLQVGQGSGSIFSNTALGNSAMVANTTGGNSAAAGYFALAAQTTGFNNSAFGREAVFSATGANNNSGFGFRALYVATGSNNSAFGSSALPNLTGGQNNTAVGFSTGAGLQTGSNNTIIGANISGLAADLSNHIIIADGSGNRRINVDSAGNVGLGTVNPRARLDVLASGSASSWSVTSGTAAIFENDSGSRCFVNIVGRAAGQSELWFSDQDAEAVARFRYNHPDNTMQFWNGGVHRLTLTSTGSFYAAADNAQELGNGAFRWSTIYAATGTINTSDEREKEWRGPLDDAELRVGKLLLAELGIFQWKDAIERKGEDGARLHFGARAQRVQAVFESQGLDAGDYAMFCYDKWDEETEPVMAEREVTKTRTIEVEQFDEETGEPLLDEDGEPEMVEVEETYTEVEVYDTGDVSITLEAGDRFGLRIDQFNAFLIAAQAEIQKDLEKRLAKLEASAA